MATIPERSALTDDLVGILGRMNTGGFMSYEDVAADLKKTVEGLKDAWPFVMSARRILRNKGKVIECLRGVGFKCLDDPGKVRAAKGTRLRIHRAANRARITLRAVEKYEDLSPQQKIEHNTYYSLYGAIATVTAVQKLKKIEAEVKKAEMRLPLERTLKAITG